MGVGRGVAGVLGGGTWENWRRALKAGSGADLGPGRRDQGRKGRGQGFGGGGVRVWRQVPLGGAARAPSQAKGQVTILALPEPSRGSFLAGALWADASSLGLIILALPQPLWDCALKLSLGCGRLLRSVGRWAQTFADFSRLGKRHRGKGVGWQTAAYTGARRDRRKQQAPPGW